MPYHPVAPACARKLNNVLLSTGRWRLRLHQCVGPHLGQRRPSTRFREQRSSCCVDRRRILNLGSALWGCSRDSQRWALVCSCVCDNCSQADAANVTCGSDCFDALQIPSSVTSLVVRDLWAHEDIVRSVITHATNQASPTPHARPTTLRCQST